MCIEDVRLQRRTYTRASTFTVAAGSSAEIVQEQRNRVSLLLSPVAAGTGFIRAQAGLNTAGTGIPIAGMQWPLLLRLQFEGDLCRQGWVAQAVGGNLTVYVLETFLEEQ